MALGHNEHTSSSLHYGPTGRMLAHCKTSTVNQYTVLSYQQHWIALVKTKASYSVTLIHTAELFFDLRTEVLIPLLIFYEL